MAADRNSDLYLIRAAVVSIGEPPIEIGEIQLKHGGAVLKSGRPMTFEGKPMGTLVFALSRIVEPFDTEAEVLVLPLQARRSAEEAIETLARILAIEHRTSHSISSPLPCVGFISNVTEDTDRLVGKRVDHPAASSLGPTGSAKAGILNDKILPLLADRLDGVALLAEALNNRHSLGRYHELLRLFERAFRRGPRTLLGPLVPFLTDASSPHGFDKREIHTWIEARPEVAHADRRPTYLLEADIRPWIGRMLEAAYDVLMNKADWRQDTTRRRDVWKPVTGSLDLDAGIFLTKGRDASLHMQFLDGFEAYPLVLGGPFEASLPIGVWLEGEGRGGVLKKNKSDVRITLIDEERQE